MAAKLISELPLLTTITGLDEFIIQDPEESQAKTKRVRANVVATYINDLGAQHATDAATYAGQAAASAATASDAIASTAASAAAAVVSASAASASATTSGNSATAASASETAAAASVAKLTGTSTTSLAIGTGSKAFTTQTGKFFDVGSHMQIVSDSDPTGKWMFGQVTAYNSGTGALTVNVAATNGSGTLADWTIYGRAGARGAVASGAGDFVGPGVSVNGNLVSFGDTTGKLGADSGKAAPTGTIVGHNDAQTLTNKTFAIGSNTFSGTTAQFNTANTDGDFATLAGAETLTNKSIAASQLTGSIAYARLPAGEVWGMILSI